MSDFVAYYRVSTERQGESGLGLEAQREAVARFLGPTSLLAAFTEVESGKRQMNYGGKMLWEQYLGKSNDLELLIEKAYCLTKLVLSTSSRFHEIALSQEVQKSDFLSLKFSEAESAALHVATAFSLIERYMPGGKAAPMSNEVLRALITSFRIQEPTALLAAYFLERYQVLDQIITQKDGPAAIGWEPEIKSSYEKQCEYLTLQENALLIVSMQHLLLTALDSWKLYRLVTGKMEHHHPIS